MRDEIKRGSCANKWSRFLTEMVNTKRLAETPSVAMMGVSDKVRPTNFVPLCYGSYILCST